jgi:hypothetical protein
MISANIIDLGRVEEHAIKEYCGNGGIALQFLN